MESSRSDGRAGQGETVVPTKWVKIALFQHLAEVLWAPIDRLSSPRNWQLQQEKNFLATTDGADENCNASTHVHLFFDMEENGSAVFQTKNKFCQFTGIFKFNQS